MERAITAADIPKVLAKAFTLPKAVVQVLY
jgi:hypothetical protein